MKHQTLTKSTFRKHYLIDVPEPLIKAIIKELRLHNPPSLSDIETVILWCATGFLSSEPFIDYHMVYGNDSKSILSVLKEETQSYLHDIEEMIK